MKKIKFLSFALAALTLLSCSKELGVDNHDPSGPSVSGEPTYAAFSFKTAGAVMSRAVETDIFTSDDEKTVNSVRLLIFSNDGDQLLETNVAVDLSGSTDKKFTTLVKAGFKKMHIFANVKAGTQIDTELNKMVVGTSTHAEFLALTYDAGTPGDKGFTLKDLHPENGDKSAPFPMSNSNEKVYEFKPKVTKEEAEVAGAGEDKNAFNVGIDFMLAKVAVVAKDATVFDNASMKVENMLFCVRNIAKKTFLTQQFDGVDIATVKGVHYDWAPANLTDPGATGWGANYDRAQKPIVPVEVSSVPTKTSIYTAENTKSTATLLVGGTTQAALNCVITPKAVYNGTDMKWDPINRRLAMGLTQPGTKGMDFVVATKAHGSIKAGDVFINETTLKKAYAMIQYTTDYGTGKDENAGDFTAPVDGMDYYKYVGGVAWYYIYIGDKDNAKQKYAILRGKKYTATINAIKGFGLPSDDIYHPELPLDQDTYINTTITVNGWTEVGNDTEL